MIHETAQRLAFKKMAELRRDAIVASIWTPEYESRWRDDLKVQKAIEQNNYLRILRERN